MFYTFPFLILSLSGLGVIQESGQLLILCFLEQLG